MYGSMGGAKVLPSLYPICHSGAQNEIFSVLCPKVSSFSAVFSGVGAQNVLFVAIGYHFLGSAGSNDLF